MDIKQISAREKALFAAGLAILLLLVSIPFNIYQKKQIGTNPLDIRLVEERVERERDDSIDVLVIGDSESYTSVSPMQIWRERGYSVYMCGQPGQTTAGMLEVLSASLSTQKPKVVIMETNALFRTKHDLDQLQDMMAERVASVIPVFQYHNLWKHLINGSGNVNIKKNYKGFVIRTDIKPYEGDGSYMKLSRKEKKISRANKDAFYKMLELCKKHGAKLVLYSAPSPRNYNMEKHNRLKRLASENHLHYIDMNMKELGIDWRRDTADGGDHLNISGAEKTTAYIERILDREGLVDHRPDGAYAGWDKLSDRYYHYAAKEIKRIRNKTFGRQTG
ncbi:SGNH/GDSL hydrolase family protein [Candidatus Weimeria sp. HCP3S3_B5]|uniref:SGNH/GDSL hydrolase family protein n=1 Tax=Candidatus Weimeria sp. HCP3S3_B5 TaxID=3438871 RepID=UPI003F8CAB80